jgi:hypothetical protein
MRALIAVTIAGCGAAAPVAPVVTPANIGRTKPVAIHPSVDPFAALADPAAGDSSTIVPGTAHFEPQDAGFDAPPGAMPLDVGLVDEQGTLVRLAVRLDHARFLLWSGRDRLFAIVARDIRVDGQNYGPPNERAEVVLHPGARVRPLARKEGRTQIRYFGALEVDGWVPDDALTDRSRRTSSSGQIPTGRPRQLVTPGTIIRGDTKWASRELALMANGYNVDVVRRLDDEWLEVEYADGDVLVHGFLSLRLPPGALHRPHPPDPPPTPITPTDMAPNGTCLYAGPDQGEPIGYLVGDQRVELAASDRLGWWKLAIDTPWGATTFAARGATKLELLPCAAVTTPAP